MPSKADLKEAAKILLLAVVVAIFSGAMGFATLFLSYLLWDISPVLALVSSAVLFLTACYVAVLCAVMD